MDVPPTSNATQTCKPFYARTRFLAFALAALVIYAYGWRVTQIDLGVLVKDIHLVRPLVVNLLKPDLVAFETEGRTPEAIFLLNPNGPGPVVSGGGPAEGTLAVSPASGNIGDRVTVSGRGLVPNSNGRLYWVNAIEQEFPLGEVRAGPDGSFVREIVVPQTARGDVQTVRAVFTWRTGKWHFSETLKLCGEKMVETIFLALMATTFAVGVAGPLSFLAARNLMTRHAAGRGIYYLVRTLFNVLRSIEPLIMAILFAVWVGIGPFAGVLALGVHSIAALGKLFSEQIESIDPGPVEAITATGASPVQVVLFAVVPQVVPQFLALGFYRWDINVRMSTIIGFVGGGGIGFLLQQWINLLQYNQAGTALLSIALVVIGLDVASARIREKLERST